MFDLKLDDAGSSFPLGALGGIIPAVILVLAAITFHALGRRRRKTRVQKQANAGPVRSPWDRAGHRDQKVRCEAMLKVVHVPVTLE